jgi:photosystem II stability/assembly factor-like uncharacterized protein
MGGPTYASGDECATSRAIPPPTDIPAFSGSQMTVAHGTLMGAYGDTVFGLKDESFMLRAGIGTWTRLPIPEGRGPRVTASRRMLFLISSQRLFRSSDRGDTWTPLAANDLRFHRLLPEGNSLYASTSLGAWRSRDDGETWTRLLESGAPLAARGREIYAAVMNPAGIVRSTDDGQTWIRLQPPSRTHSVAALIATRRGTLIAAAGGLFRSTDRGANWTPTGLSGQRVASLIADRPAAYASMDDGTLWGSADAGLRWTLLETQSAAPERPRPWVRSYRQMVLADARLFGMADKGLFASADGGVSWAASGLDHRIGSIVRLDESWFAATNAGVFRSPDLARWTECSSGLPEPYLIAAIEQRGIFRARLP